MIQGNITNVTIEDNLIEDIHSAGWAFGVEITPTNVSDTLPPMNVTVIKNTIRGINDGSIYDVWNTSSGNPYFNAPYPGVCVIVEESYLVSANASGIEIHYNNFVDTSVHPTYPIVGVVNKDTNHILNATLNWWDDKSGPYDLYGSVETPPWTSNPLNESNTDGGGCAVSNYTDYTPWLYSEWKFGLVCNVDNTTYPIYYGSIQAAVDDAGINETIKVYPGVYKEKIILNKSLKLKGDPIINGNGSVGIKIEANYTLIENFTIINCSRGIYAVASYTLHNITINNCTIYNCTWAPGYGIHFDGVINSTINDTEINDTTHGIYLSSTNYTEILNCVLHHNSENGIYILSSSDNNTIYKCLIHNNTGAGIYVFGGRDNHINKSAIRDNSNHGIYLWSAVNNSIINSRICDNSPYGIYIFSASTANTIYNNTFSGSSGWDVFVSGSNDNTFINNTFSSYPTKASFSYNGDFSVKGVTNPPAMPTGVENISKFLNISLTGTWINVTFYYEDTDLADPIHETYMRVWRYTTTWQREGWFSWQGINETKNEISVNITSAGSIFAPLQDITPPSSSCSVKGPYWNTTGTVNVTWTASDNVNLSYIELWYRYRANNVSSWGAWKLAGYTSTASGTSDSGYWLVDLTALDGEGLYEFATNATDDAGNYEGDPLSADDAVGYDITPPSSSCSVKGPYWNTTGTVNVTWTASDNVNLSYIELWYRYRANNVSSWGAWKLAGYTSTASGTSDSGYWLVDLTALDGEGLYEFATNATDDAGNYEGDPLSADDAVGYDATPPETTKYVGGPNVTENDEDYWITSDTPVWLNATDNLSGVNATYYRIWTDGVWHPMDATDSYGGNDNITLYNGEYWYIRFLNNSIDFEPIYFTEECTHYLEYFSVDTAGNEEEIHNDTLYVDNSAPYSDVDDFTPYCQWVNDTNPITITVTAYDLPEGDCGVGISNITLYYRYARYNHSFTQWIEWGTLDSEPWQWSFNAPNGSGYYQFYTVAYDLFGHHKPYPNETTEPEAILCVLYNHTFTLYDGWNLITMPVKNASITTAEELGEYLNAFYGDMCIVITKWDASEQRYISHVVGYGGEGFTLEPGEGYFIYMEIGETGESREFYIIGALIEYDEISMPLYVGYNLLGWANIEATNASELLHNISNCTKIGEWDEALQIWPPEYTVDAPPGFPVFEVAMGDAFFAYRNVQEVIIWDGGRSMLILPPLPPPVLPL